LAEPRLCDAGALVGEERFQRDPFVGFVDADDCEFDAAGEQAAEDLAACGDLDFDVDVGVVAAEAAERVGEQVGAGGGGGAEMDRACLEAGEGAELLLACRERGKGLRRMRGEHATSLGQPAAAAVPLDESLSGRSLECAHVLAGRGLPDAYRLGCRGKASVPVDLDQQAHPRRVPELREQRHSYRLRRYVLLRISSSAMAS